LLNLFLLIAFGILFVFYFWTLYNIPILAVGIKGLWQPCKRKGHVRNQTPKQLPKISIIVPVKNEEKVVERILLALLKLNYPHNKREIIVVEDGSTDKTADICAEYSKHYPHQIKFIHQPESYGKPSALNRALKYAKGEIVAIFDADNVPEPNALINVAKYFENSLVAAVQGRQHSINANVNMLSRFISYEEAVRYEAYLRGKDLLNLFVPLTGSCYFVRKRVLDEVKGWDNQSLSEDMELSAKLIERGYEIRYASDVQSWQENPTRLIQLFKQRTRWFRGSMEVSLKYGKLLRKLDKRRIDAEITLTGPFMFLPSLASYLMGIYAFFRLIQPSFLFTVMAQGTMLLTTITLFLIGMALLYLSKPRRITNLLWLPFVWAYWSLQNVIAFYALLQIVLKRPKKWEKTVKTGIIANHAFTLMLQ
jgi:cellulose synthase/poly-beta-1,6-N-acetylglucosamine synthase-like glycosyltransferase